MCDVEGIGEADDLMQLIDWEQLDALKFDDSSFFNDMGLFDGSAEEVSNLPSGSPVSLSVEDIEQLLMNDDGLDKVDDAALPHHDIANCLLSDSPQEAPIESDRSGSEVVDLSDGGRKSSSPEVETNSNTTDDGEEADPIVKKRKRQERNRDAAVRSRERKKQYVKDLEMKSRYFEAECKRLGVMLNCVTAENQALRLSLQSSKAFDTSRTKQESAVLLLESLLLGSLLWFLGTMCLLIPPEFLWSTKEAPPEDVDDQNRGSLAPRKKGNKIFEQKLFQSFMMGKRCKASRSRMKSSSSLTPEVLA